MQARSVWPAPFLIMQLAFLSPRLRTSGIHVGVSAFVAAAASLLVFRFWYPSPFAAIAGGTQLFLMLVSIDAMMGPLLTGVAASPGKPRRELVRDLSVIVVLQLVAFGYGMYSMALARPVALVYEIDLLRLVTAADLEPATLSEASPELRTLSWHGPTLLAVVKPQDPAEQLRTVELGMAGIPLAMLPRYWREYAAHADAAWRAARPVAALLARYPASADAVAQVAAASGQPASALRFLPLQARRSDWVALLAAPGARVVGYLPLEGFF